MSRIHEDLPFADFEKPDGIVTATVCKESGKLAIDGVCTNDPRGNMAYTEYFATGTAPTDYCDHHILANICADSGRARRRKLSNTYNRRIRDWRLCETRGCSLSSDRRGSSPILYDAQCTVQ